MRQLLFNNLVALSKKHFWNVVSGVLLLFLLWQRLPIIVQNLKTQGTTVELLRLKSVDGAETVFPNGKNSVLIFWATWCGPCKIEMYRLQKAVNEGLLSNNQIFAVNMSEDAETVKKSFTENNYTFISLLDENANAQQRFSVELTPTIVHLNSTGDVSFVGSGLNPLLIVDATRFLNP